MAKRAIVTEAPAADAATSRAIVKSKYEALMRTMIAGERERAADAGAAREKIGEAVEKQHLHAKAFSWTKTLRKMPVAKRDEMIWHLMTYFRYEGWPGEDLLADRQPVDASEVTFATKLIAPVEDDPPDDEDSRGRPAHLRAAAPGESSDIF